MLLLPAALLLAGCGNETGGSSSSTNETTSSASTSTGGDSSSTNQSASSGSSSSGSSSAGGGASSGHGGASSSTTATNIENKEAFSFAAEDAPDIESELDDQTKETVTDGTTIDVSSLEDGEKKEITEGGTYILTGSNDNARIYVNSSGDVKLVLSDLTLTSLTDAAIEVKTASSFEIYLPSGTKNTISDSENNTIDGAIVVKKTALNISGTGYLYVAGKGLATDEVDSGVGIHAPKGINIENAHVIVTESNSHAINGKAGVSISNAKISVTSNKDGIHSAEGSIDVENSTFIADTYGDGADATTTLTFKDVETHIVTHGTFTLYDSADDDDEGTLSDDAKYVADGSGYKKISSDDISRYNTRYYLAEKCKGLKADGAVSIDGGDYYIHSDDDSIASDVSIDITGGDFVLYTLDQAINSDQTINIGSSDDTSNDEDFIIRIFNSFEGIQGGDIDFYNGYTYIQSNDDGINATSDTLTSVSMNFHDNSTVWVNAEGDGIDSNGTITMDGGDLYVFGPTNGGDSSLDFDQSFTLSGGNLFAFSQQGMIEVPSSSGVNIANINLGSYSEGQVVTIASDTYEFSAILPKGYSSMNVIVAGSMLTTGSTYSVYTGGSSSASYLNNVHVGETSLVDGTSVTSFTVSSGVNNVGSSTGGQGGPGGGEQGGGPGGQGGQGGQGGGPRG